MVKHIRKPGIKAGFMGKFLKLGSMLLLLPLQISGHKQTPVHLGGHRSPRKGTIFGHRRWLAAPWPDRFWWMGLQAATGRFSSTSKMLHGLQRNLEPTQGCKRQDQKKKIKTKKKRIELLRGPGNSFSHSRCWLTSYPSPLRGVVSQCLLHASYYPH